MLLVSDVHGATAALRAVAATGEQLLVLGDLINFIDYRNLDGILTDVLGRATVAEIVALRTAGEFTRARRVWDDATATDPERIRREYRAALAAAYEGICPALAGSGAIVTFGNVDHPGLLASHLPTDCRFVDAAVVELEGWRVGIVGGGVPSPLGVPGEVGDDDMAHRLASLGPVEVLCTHAAPAVDPLQSDVIGGRQKGSVPVLDYLREHRPDIHYFGDIHQPQAVRWRVGSTLCRNVGYFRATGRAVRHEPRSG